MASGRSDSAHLPLGITSDSALMATPLNERDEFQRLEKSLLMPPPGMSLKAISQAEGKSGRSNTVANHAHLINPALKVEVALSGFDLQLLAGTVDN